MRAITFLILASSLAAQVGVDLARAYPKLAFRRPVQVGVVPDGSGRLFVVEQHGVVHVFEDDEGVAKTNVFLDISDRVSRRGNEEGLLGFAFHTEFRKNGRFFVHYSSKVKDHFGVIARFGSKPGSTAGDPSTGDPATETEVLSQSQPYRNHNGGEIAFGPDGYLYISFGDGGLRGRFLRRVYLGQRLDIHHEGHLLPQFQQPASAPCRNHQQVSPGSRGPVSRR